MSNDLDSIIHDLAGLPLIFNCTNSLSTLSNSLLVNLQKAMKCLQIPNLRTLVIWMKVNQIRRMTIEEPIR
ncbi:hypothetical protein BpHYR1_048741 [Brachionus plicatilis]|uniref:Uncharacterized protein n=1 Tax=Brachionus plicatilis TaxID=10195 RepID=A0A3M7QBE0_BRAPC|nr:hypothetical protein BpHYR1_048741 [Brachionus plicatilis]